MEPADPHPSEQDEAPHQGGEPEQDEEPEQAEEPEHDRSILYAAAIEAEYQTGRREPTEAAARRGVFERVARIVGGFVLVGVGIAALPLPGPGWLIIILGLGILPFAWTERLVLIIRRKVPGIPEDGRIPTSTWIVMGLVVLVTTLVGVFLGDKILEWLGDRWQSLVN